MNREVNLTKRVKTASGKDAATADAKRQRQEQTLRAVGMGIKVVLEQVL